MNDCAVWSPLAVIVGSMFMGIGAGVFIALTFRRFK